MVTMLISSGLDPVCYVLACRIEKVIEDLESIKESVFSKGGTDADDTNQDPPSPPGGAGTSAVDGGVPSQPLGLPDVPAREPEPPTYR